MSHNINCGGTVSSDYYVRQLDRGMGQAVASRTYLRKDEDWGQLANRVALGNTMLHNTGERDFISIRNAIASGELLTAGRHLQHGDIDQPTRNLEVFSNCSTSCSSFLKFYLLMNGSGVGRNYSDEFMIVDWRNMPHVYCVLSESHPDYNPGVLSREASVDLIDNATYFKVEDSREGWSKIIEIIETAAFEMKLHDIYVFDFSDVRKNGAPIKGMQNRPASGPIPLIEAINKVAALKYNEICWFDYETKSYNKKTLGDIDPWMQTMFVDHYTSECVANGGARRSARIAVKYWKDKAILDYVGIKKNNPWMWSSNNSVGVDKEFWDNARTPGTKAYEVFNSICEHSYKDGTGEPGLINLDKLTVSFE